MIVQCPSCSTRFSVSNSQLNGIAKPQFHCSRCNYLFVHKSNPDTSNLSTLAKENISEPDNPANLASEPSTSLNATKRPKRVGVQLELLPDDSLNDDVHTDGPITSSPVTSFSDLVDNDTNDTTHILTANWPQDDTKLLEVDMSTTLNKQFDKSAISSGIFRFREHRQAASKEHSTSCQTISWPSLTQKTESISCETNNHRTLQNHSRKEIEAIDKAASEVLSSLGTISDHSPLTQSLEYSLTENTKQKVNDTTFRNQLSPVFPEESSFGIDSFNKKAASPPGSNGKTNKKRWRLSPLMFICILSVCTTLSFAVLSGIMSQSPSFLDQVYSLAAIDFASAPPDGLELINLHSEIITLDDGQQAIDIKGNILNNTILPLEDIKIEAKLYGTNNQPLEELTVKAHNSIVKAVEIGHLRNNAIQTLQHQPLTEEDTIKPGGESPFRIIFTDSVNKAAWYTTRVYSVKRLSTKPNAKLL